MNNNSFSEKQNVKDPAVSELKVVAYLHPTHDGCVTVDPTAYHGPRKLVLLNDVIDKIEYLEAGLSEWRTYAVEAGCQLAAARKEIERLKAVATKTAANTPIPPGFSLFWEAWPQSHRKVNKKACLKRWVSAGLERFTEQIVSHVEACKISTDWTKDAGSFIPAPLVYLNQDRYLAPPPPPASAAGRPAGSINNIKYNTEGVQQDGSFS